MTAWKLDTRDLLRRPGSRVERRLTLPAPDDMGTEVIGVPAGAPIDLDLALESVTEGVLVSGRVSAAAEGSCIRCLAPVTMEASARLQELYVYPERAKAAEDAGDDGEEDLRELDGRVADLEGAVRDALVPTLPFQPLCRPDCRGLCPDCGERWDDLDEGHSHELLDPRWSALAGLLADEMSETSADGEGGRA